MAPAGRLLARYLPNDCARIILARMRALPLLLLAAVLTACDAKPAVEKAPPPVTATAPTAPAASDPAVDRTFDFVERTLRLVGTNRTAAAAYSGQVDTGGDPITYIASNMPDGVVYSPIIWGQPLKPRSVVVRAEPGGYAVEAYLDDLAKPVRSTTVPIPPARRE